ncbi:MAG: response regulator [Nitrospiraceae bacterium]
MMTPLFARLNETLAAEGYQVTVVSDGLAGVEAVKDQPVHVVLTDLQMPGIDGLEDRSNFKG